jgi:hypothetical protein
VISCTVCQTRKALISCLSSTTCADNARLASSVWCAPFGRAFAGAVDLDDVLIDVMSHGRLLFHRSSDLLILIDDHAHRTKDVFQRLLDLL